MQFVRRRIHCQVDGAEQQRVTRTRKQDALMDVMACTTYARNHLCTIGETQNVMGRLQEGGLDVKISTAFEEQQNVSEEISPMSA